MSDIQVPEKEDKVQKPEDRIKVFVNGGERELFMSAGLLRRIVSVFNTVDSLTNFYVDPELQMAAMMTALATRDERGKLLTNELTIDDFEMSTEDGKKLIDWINGHVLYFFIDGALTMKADLENREAALQKLTVLLSGTQNSVQTKPSAGDSSAANQTSS